MSERTAVDHGRLARGIHGLFEAVLKGQMPLDDVLESLQAVTVKSAVSDEELGKLARAEHDRFMQLYRGEIVPAQHAPDPEAHGLRVCGGPFHIAVARSLTIRQLLKWSGCVVDYLIDAGFLESAVAGTSLVTRTVVLLEAIQPISAHKDSAALITAAGYELGKLEELLTFAGEHTQYTDSTFVIAPGTVHNAKMARLEFFKNYRPRLWYVGEEDNFPWYRTHYLAIVPKTP